MDSYPSSHGHGREAGGEQLVIRPGGARVRRGDDQDLGPDTSAVRLSRQAWATSEIDVSPHAPLAGMGVVPRAREVVDLGGFADRREAQADAGIRLHRANSAAMSSATTFESEYSNGDGADVARRSGLSLLSDMARGGRSIKQVARMTRAERQAQDRLARLPQTRSAPPASPL